MNFNDYPKGTSRREFLNAGMTTLMIFGGFACATTDLRQAGQSTASRESEQKDKAVDNIFLVNLAVKKNESVLRDRLIGAVSAHVRTAKGTDRRMGRWFKSNFSCGY